MAFVGLEVSTLDHHAGITSQRTALRTGRTASAAVWAAQYADRRGDVMRPRGWADPVVATADHKHTRATARWATDGCNPRWSCITMRLQVCARHSGRFLLDRNDGGREAR
jgi:hypothetical protein